MDVICTEVYDHKKLEPVKVWVETRYVKRRWWFGDKEVYYVCTQYMSWGPFSQQGEAWEKADTLQSVMG